MQSRNVKTIIIRQTRPYPFFALERNEVSMDEELPAIRKWLRSEETDIGKIRELVSFKLVNNHRKFIEEFYTICEDNHKKIDLITTDRKWADDTEEVIREVFRVLDVRLNEGKVEGWRRIRDGWRKNYGRLIDWYEHDLPEITRAIVNGESRAIDSNTDFAKQAAIMAYTMKDFGRRIMLSAVEFPKNTKDLHNLLK